MSIQAINNINTTPKTTTIKATKEATEHASTAVNSTPKGFDETAVVYEKSQTSTDSVTVKNNTFDREAIIAQMKADTEARMNQLTDIVKQMMTQQGNAVGLSDDMWKFLAKGDFEVSADVKAQAQADIAEDGYWGVAQTSDRILDFAKALSGGDASKADLLLDAFKKGFEQATGAWGKELPEISKKTYEAVEEKFEAWKKEAEEQKIATQNANANATAQATMNITVDPMTGATVK